MDDLVVLPDPYEDESPASWLIRVAALHKILLSGLLPMLGISSPARDLDSVANFSRMSSMYVDREVPYAVKAMAKFFEKAGRVAWSAEFLRTEGAQRTAYTGYCLECLHEAREPYLRAAWRIRHWKICPQHRCRIQDHCAACRAPIYIRKIRAPFLTCPTCDSLLSAGAGLAMVDEFVVEQVIQWELDFQRISYMGTYERSITQVGCSWLFAPRWDC